MTLSDALALIDKPDQLRVKFAEAVGWKNIREQDYCEAHVNPYDGPVLQFWQGIDPETGEKDEIPPITLDNIAAEEAKLSDEEHRELRLHLNWVTDELLKDSGGMKDWHRQRDSLSALQRAAAFVAVKGE